MSFQSPFLRTLQERGFLYQGTDLEGLDRRLSGSTSLEGLVAYSGFDATAKSLHIGSLVTLMPLKWWLHYGGTVLGLVGEATTKIGDPSGKNTTRPCLEETAILSHFESLTAFLQGFFGAKAKVKIVNNQDWLGELKYLDLLRDMGAHFSLHRMLSFEMVKQRLENHQPITFTEFNYMLLQAYDFWHLYKTENCILQLGGSDQWGNIVCGVEWIRKKEKAEVFGVTYPLLLNAQGQKMGKTAEGAVWLSGDWLSPYAFWQFWRNVEDREVMRFLKLFTFLPLPSLEELCDTWENNGNTAKTVLADQVTSLIHGDHVLPAIHETVQRLFYGAKDTADSVLPHALWSESTPSLLHALVNIGFASSLSEARRLIRAGSVKWQNEKMTDELYQIKASDFVGKDRGILQVGKKSFGHLIKNK